MNRFLFLRDSSKKWILLGERIEKGKDFLINLMEKIGGKIKFIKSKRLFQEIFFIEAMVAKENIVVLYPSCYSQKRASLRFRLFLEKEMGRHTLKLVLLAVALPFTALLGFVPGPNVLFWPNLGLFYLNLKAVKGIKTLLKNSKLIPDPTLGKWETEGKTEENFKELKEKFSLEHPELLMD